jgi:outer membrane protein assembly factor BamB
MNTKRLWIANYGGEILIFDIVSGNRISVLHLSNSLQYKENECKDDSELSLETFSVYADPISSPGNHSLYFVTTKGLLVCIHAKNMTFLWAYQLHSPIFSTPLIYYTAKDLANNIHNIIIASVDGSIKCFLILNNGNSNSNNVKSDSVISLRWKNTYQSRPFFSSPCLISYKDSQYILIGSHDGKLRCLHANTGVLLWQKDFGSIIYSSPCCFYHESHPNILHVLFATTGGNIHLVSDLFGHLSSGDKLQSSRYVSTVTSSGEIYSSPVMGYSNGSVYIGCRNDTLIKLNF